MNKTKLNQILGIVYVVCGLALFFVVAWEFLLRAAIAFVALSLVYYGLKMRGYPMSRFLFIFQQWRSRF